MKRILCLISSSPASTQASRGLALAREWENKGHTVRICLLQDSVYTAIDRSANLDDNPLPGAERYVLADDLHLRGFSVQDLRQGFQTLDYPTLMKMMMEETDQVLGVF